MNKKMLELRRKEIKEKVDGCSSAILRREQEITDLSDEKEIWEFLLSNINEKLEEMRLSDLMFTLQK